MFATNHHRHHSDRPLDSAAPLIAALVAGRTPDEARAVGASIAPWQIISDAIIFLDHGAKRAAHRLIPVSVAATIAGEFDLLDGMSSRADFFQDPPMHEIREISHSHSSLPIACVYEAMGRGRFDILDMLVAKARASVADRGDDERGRYHHRHAESLLEFRQQERETLLRQLSASSKLDMPMLLAGQAWISNLTPEHQRALSPNVILSIACEAGNSTAVLAALSLGAKPLRSHVYAAASHGALDAAATMAPLADEANLPRPGSKAATRERHERPSESVVAEMVDSYARALHYIARGATEWRSPTDTSRESTWADYSDHRDDIHRACMMGLAGAFDSAQDDPKALAQAKERLASVARALSSLAQPGDEERLTQIEAERPGATPLAEELILLAHVGSPRLGAALDRAEQAQGAKLVPALIKSHTEAIAWADTSSSRRHPAERVQSLLDNRDKLHGALFACYERESSVFDSASRDVFRAYLEKAGLAMDFERKALEASTAAPAKRGRPLKA